MARKVTCFAVDNVDSPVVQGGMQWYKITYSTQFKDDLMVVPTGLENLRYPQLYRMQEGWVRGIVRFPFIVTKLP